MSQYVGENFNGVLFLLREPDSGGERVSSEDNSWISNVLNCKPVVNEYDAEKYRKAFSAMLNFIGHESTGLSRTAFDNIYPYSGEASMSEDYRRLKSRDKSNRAFQIIDDIKPEYIFTCYDIYNALKEDLNKKNINYVENHNGLTYKRGQKKYLKLEYNNRQLSIYEIYHPCLGWNII